MLSHVEFTDRELTVQEQMWLQSWADKSDIFSLEKLVIARAVNPRFNERGFRQLGMPTLMLVVVPALGRSISATWESIKQQSEALERVSEKIGKPS